MKRGRRRRGGRCCRGETEEVGSYVVGASERMKKVLKGCFGDATNLSHANAFPSCNDVVDSVAHVTDAQTHGYTERTFTSGDKQNRLRFKIYQSVYNSFLGPEHESLVQAARTVYRQDQNLPSSQRFIVNKAARTQIICTDRQSRIRKD